MLLFFMHGTLDPDENVLSLNKNFNPPMSTMNFTVYSREGCPYCSKVIQVLQLAEFRFVEYKLDRDFDRTSFYGQFGNGSTFPQVVIDSTNLGGCTETVQYLKEKKLV